MVLEQIAVLVVLEQFVTMFPASAQSWVLCYQSNALAKPVVSAEVFWVAEYLNRTVPKGSHSKGKTKMG